MMMSLLDLFFNTDKDKILIRKTIISYFKLNEVSNFLSLNNLSLNIINIIISDDDDDEYNIYPSKLVLTSSLCDYIQHNFSKERERSHFHDQYEYPRKQLLDLILPKLQCLEVKPYVIMKRFL